MILKNVSKYYAQTAALKNISLEIEEGKITAILGESGAGKTTFLNILSGLTSFEGQIDGKEYQKGTNVNCSYLFQDAMLLPNLTAEGNLKFVLPKSERENVLPYLEKVGLKGKETCYPCELSGGEKQRVAIARAFLSPHELLLMDEPFSSLDLENKRELISLATRLWEERKNTVVFVTHDVHEAAMLASKAYILKKGELKSCFSLSSPYPRDFLTRYVEEDAFVKELLISP